MMLGLKPIRTIASTVKPLLSPPPPPQETLLLPEFLWGAQTSEQRM